MSPKIYQRYLPEILASTVPETSVNQSVPSCEACSWILGG